MASCPAGCSDRGELGWVGVWGQCSWHQAVLPACSWLGCNSEPCVKMDPWGKGTFL